MQGDIDFDTLMHHKEVIKTLDEISIVLSERNNNDITGALDKQTEAINEFTGAILALPKPEVNVEVNQKGVVSSIDELAANILSGQRSITEALIQQRIEQKTANTLLKEVLAEVSKKRQWEFHFEKDSAGQIVSSTATQIK